MGEKNQDYNSLTAIISIVIGLIYGILTLNIRRATIGAPLAPLYFPLFLSVAMIIFGVILLLVSNFSKTIESIKAWKNRSSEDRNISQLILLTSIGCIIYAIIFEVLGYMVATFLFMMYLLLLTNGKTNWKINTIISLIFSVGLYYVFNNLLNIILPPISFI